MSVKNVRCPVCRMNDHDNGSDNGHMFLMSKKDSWMCDKTQYHPDGMMVIVPNDPETMTPVFEGEMLEYVESHMDQPVPQRDKHDSFGDCADFGEPDSYSSSFGGTVDDTPSSMVREVIPWRGVPASHWKKFGVEFLVGPDKEPVKQFYPITKKGKLKTHKVRVIEDKDFYWEGKVKKPDLFGMNTLGGKIPRSLLVIEGEVDCVSASYMLTKYKVKVVSGTAGDSMKDLIDNAELLEKIDNLVFCPDNDLAGNEFTEKFVGAFPHAKVMVYSEKDANKMLTEGKEAEFVDAYFKADKYRPPSIVEVMDISESLRTAVPMGLSYPWSTLDAITYGAVPNSIVSVGAGPGCGKSTVVRGIQENMMFNHDVPVGIIPLEESKELCLRNLVGYQMNQRIHIPGAVYDTDLAVHYAEMLEGRAFIYDRRFFNGNWDKVERAIRYLHAMGVCHFFIDPLTALVTHLDASNQNTALGKIMMDLSALIQELPIYVMLVNHLNNPTSGKAHDEGGVVLPSQFTGSKAQWRFSTDMWGFERNILSEDENIKNIMRIRNLKHRTDGSLTGRVINLGYNIETGRLEEQSSKFACADQTTVIRPGQKTFENEVVENVAIETPTEVVNSTPSLSKLLGGGK